jgi:hypothetical protein
MKQSDSLDLAAPGSLERPGIIGRLVRLALGVLCLYGLQEIITYRAELIETPVSSLPNFALLIALCVCIINYVVNIGFSREWGRLPLYLSLGIFGLTAGASLIIEGSADTGILGISLFAWLFYFYAHLGISFVVASLLATPGCEMRAIPDLVGRASGQGAQEHHCPAAFITKIDEWEQRRSQSV